MGTEPGGEAAWREWKAQCALDLCSETTVAHLRRFGGSRFRRYVERCLPRCGPGQGRTDLLSPRDAWHRFEVHLRVRGSRAGKRYKDWLFHRAEHAKRHWEAIIEAGASVLMRDVVREYLRHEHVQPWMRSLHDPLIAAEGAPLTLEDLLPGTLDPSGEAERTEIEAAAARTAEAILAGLTPKERIAIAARGAGMPLSHAEVLNAAGCGKSALNAAYHNVFRKIAERVRKDAEAAGADERSVFALLVYEKLEKLIYFQKSPEFRALSFSIDMEDVPVRRGKTGYGSAKS